MLLEAAGMTAGYGGAPIVRGVDLSVDRGEIAVIVGPNGAGKSTAMKAVFGMIELSDGSVRFAGREISGLAPQARARAGMGFVPQSRNVFASMSVEENLEMGAFLLDDPARFEERRAEVFELFPILAEKRRQRAGELSGGQRQQLAVGRALMAGPSLLILDEPTAGVSPKVMDELFDRIVAIKRAEVAVLMVEQNARQALAIADRGYVLVAGENRHSGSGGELLADPHVRRAFLGG